MAYYFLNLQSSQSATGFQLGVDQSGIHIGPCSARALDKFPLHLVQGLGGQRSEEFHSGIMLEYSVSAQAAGEIVGACLLGGSGETLEVLALDVGRFYRQRGLESAMLAQSVILAAASGSPTLSVELAPENLFVAKILVGLGFEWDAVTDTDASRWALTARLFAGLGQTDEARSAFVNGATRLRELGDERAEGLDFQAACQGENTLLYWLDLAAKAPSFSLAEGFLESLTVEGVCQVAPMVERVFYDHPYQALKAYFPPKRGDCSTLARCADGRMMGACLVNREERGAVVTRLMTDAAARGRGVAKAMLSRSLELLRGRGCRAVLAHVHEANWASRRTFESAGFLVAETLEQLLEFAALSGFIAYRDLVTLVGNDRAAEATEECWKRKIAVLHPPA